MTLDNVEINLSLLQITFSHAHYHPLLNNAFCMTFQDELGKESDNCSEHISNNWLSLFRIIKTLPFKKSVIAASTLV